MLHFLCMIDDIRLPAVCACACHSLQLGLPIYAKSGGGDAAADEDDDKVSHIA
jgi:hypothetical protein